MTAVAVLGLGNLGLAVAERLLAQGHRVRGYDVSGAAADGAGRAGVEVAGSVGDAAEGAEVVCLVVGTAAQVRECLEELPARAEGGGPVLLVHATMAPADVVTLGPGVVDAPVSGGPDRAREGRLAVMVGGPEDLLDRARVVLEDLGRVLRTGAVGSAQLTKLVGQVVFMTTQGALLEGERLATSAGVAWPDVLAALREGTADSWAGRHWGFFDDVAADYDRSGLAPDQRPWAKDLATALRVAAEQGLDLPLTTAAAAHVPGDIDAHAARTARGDGSPDG